ncbi:HAD hydrolase family protein [Propioniciclava soli]|uniref:HAD hydrolase family protein n=1 Tax=Propioniciclava soli TaxID=2775081 RepID=A0ABZ3C6C6_9ACTN|nr:HAD hydrolase family protein [Propioniciclava soli]
MARRILFLDVDGTLVDYHNDLPASAVAAIRQARAAGHLVYLCSGRAKPEVSADRVVLHGMVFGGELYRADAMKVSYLLGSPDDHTACVAAFGHLQHGTWGGRGAEALFGDVGVTGVTKAYAVDALLTHLGADRADTVAFGDATVDLPMFAACGTAVAMGNASPDVQSAADLVTDDVEADGLAHAFARLGLLGPPR